MAVVMSLGKRKKKNVKKRREKRRKRGRYRERNFAKPLQMSVVFYCIRDVPHNHHCCDQLGEGEERKGEASQAGHCSHLTSGPSILGTLGAHI